MTPAEFKEAARRDHFAANRQSMFDDTVTMAVEMAELGFGALTVVEHDHGFLCFKSDAKLPEGATVVAEVDADGKVL